MNEKYKVFHTIQALRFVAATMVILFHLGIYQSGYKGVDLFFIISGFVIFYRYDDASPANTHKKRKYFLNRFTKIYILYWTILLLRYFVEPFGVDNSFIKSIFLIPGHHAFLQVSWSLSYELYFYMVYGFSMYIKNRNTKKIAFVILFTISCVVTALDTTTLTLKGSAINFLIGHNLWQFLLGILAGYFFNRRDLIHSVAFVSFLLSLCLFIAIDIPFGTSDSSLIYGLIGFVIVYSVASLEKRQKLSFLRIFDTPGQASYAMYLIAPVILLVLKPDNLTEAVFVIALVTAVSIVINIFYEEPMLKWTRKKFPGYLTFKKD